MTVSSTNTQNSYAGNGSTTSFPITFKYLDKDDVDVVLVDDTTGAETAWVDPADYSLTAPGDSGTLTAVVAPASGKTLVINRLMAATQEVDYVENDPFPAETHEKALDRLTMIAQELKSNGDRTLFLSIVDALNVDTTLPTPEAGKHLAWNATADGLVNDDSPDQVAGAAYTVEEQTATASQTVFNLTSMTYTPGIRNLAVFVQGVHQAPSAYTETDTDTITFSEGLDAGDIVVFVKGNSVSNTVTDANNVQYTPSGTGAVQSNVQAKLREMVTAGDFGVSLDSSPFGRAGLKCIIGQNRDAHYGFGSVIQIPDSTKWVMVYRKGTTHGTEDGTEVRAADSYDFGESWVNDRQIQTDATTDSRPDRIAQMGNGRVGFFCNRASAGATNKYPLFIYSDDEGTTWTKTEVPTSSTTYTFQSVGGLVPFPASQGGHDTLGFITYGYINASGLDAFTTNDNGATWSIESDVTGTTVVSENISIRIGNQDKWLMYVRDSGNLKVYATTNMLSWGTQRDAGIENLSTPPGGFYDSETGKVYYIGTARAGKEIDGYKNHLLIVGEDADALWTNNGIFTESYDVLTAAPHWTTGYAVTFDTSLGRCLCFTAGENQASGDIPSAMWLLGDFDTKAKDLTVFVDYFTRNMRHVENLEITATDNVTTTYPLYIENAAGSAYVQKGAYADNRVMGGASYTYDITGANNITITHTATGTETINYDAATATNINVTANLTIDAPLTTYTKPVDFDDVSVGGFFNVGAAANLAISGGVVTATQTRHTISNEASASTDDLDTINGGSDGDILILSSATSSQDPTLKDGTGNLRLAGDFTLSRADDTITLIYHASVWKEISRSDNTA